MVASPDNLLGYQSIAKIPTGISADTNGNVYFSDAGNCVIRKIDGVTSKLFTKIGTNLCGNNGDGLPGTSTMIGRVGNIFVDSSGQIYWPEYENGVVRMLSTVGAVQTVVGSVSRSSQFFDNVPCQDAGLSNPQGIYYQISSGSLFIAESDAHVIRKRSSSGTISTIAGSDARGNSVDGANALTTRLGSPADVFVNESNVLYFTESFSGYVSAVRGDKVYHVVGPSSSLGRYVGDDSDATLAFLNQPNQIWGDTVGTLYVADGGNGFIRKITTSNIISSLGNASGAFSFNIPYGVYGDTSNHLYVSDFA
eukprot:gene13907-15347_t